MNNNNYYYDYVLIPGLTVIVMKMRDHVNSNISLQLLSVFALLSIIQLFFSNSEEMTSQ